MLNYTRTRRLLLALILAFGTGYVSANELVLITHRDSNLTISSDHLKRLYFGKISSLPNGKKVTAVVFARNDIEFQNFAKSFLGRTSQQLRSYWAKQLFTGKGNLPIRVSSLEEMIDRISSNVAYVGYIPKDALQESVKILSLKD